jgi:hypothetical protein
MDFTPIRPRRRDLIGPVTFVLAVSLFAVVGGTGPLAFLAVGLAFTATFLAWRSVTRLDRERAEALRRWCEEFDRVYALPLRSAELAALRVPTTHPGAVAVTYGSTKLVTSDGAHRLTVHLHWTGNRLTLVDDSGAELRRTAR